MNSYLVFFVLSYCSIFAFFMNFDDISYLSKYSSIYEDSSSSSAAAGNHALLRENRGFFSPFNSSADTKVLSFFSGNSNNETIRGGNYSDVLVVWEVNKWSALYYSLLFIIPVTLTVLYLSPDVVLLDFSSLFIYLGMLFLAVIAYHDSKWLLNWTTVVSQNTVSLNTMVTSSNNNLSSLVFTVSTLNNSIINIENDIDKMVLKTIHEAAVSKLQSEIDEQTIRISAMESKMEQLTSIIDLYGRKLRELDTITTKLTEFKTQTETILADQNETNSLVNATLVSIISVVQSTANVMLWSEGTLPDGWMLCDGTNGTVNLLNRFVVSAGEEYQLQETGGNNQIKLTDGQMFPRIHPHPGRLYGRDIFFEGGEHRVTVLDVSSGRVGEEKQFGNGDPIDVRPKYAALYFICKKRII
jgi:hypothetical protein